MVSLEPRAPLRENKWDWEVGYLEIPGHEEEELSNVPPVLLVIPVSQATSFLQQRKLLGNILPLT